MEKELMRQERQSLVIDAFVLETSLKKMTSSMNNLLELIKDDPKYAREVPKFRALLPDGYSMSFPRKEKK